MDQISISTNIMLSNILTKFGKHALKTTEVRHHIIFTDAMPPTSCRITKKIKLNSTAKTIKMQCLVKSVFLVTVHTINVLILGRSSLRRYWIVKS